MSVMPASEPKPAGQTVGAAPPSKDQLLSALRECYDPEIPVNIVDLGLIYLMDVTPEGRVTVNMTLTAVGCPVSGWMQETVRLKIMGVPGVTDAAVNIVFDPPWDTKKLTPEGREQLLAMGFPV